MMSKSLLHQSKRSLQKVWTECLCVSPNEHFSSVLVSSSSLLHADSHERDPGAAASCLHMSFLTAAVRWDPLKTHMENYSTWLQKCVTCGSISTGKKEKASHWGLDYKGRARNVTNPKLKVSQPLKGDKTHQATATPRYCLLVSTW